MARFKVGIHTITWNTFYKNYSLKDILWEMKEAGYDGVECYEPLSKMGPLGVFKMMIQEEGLQLAALSSNLSVVKDEKQELDEIKEKVNYGSHFEVKNIILWGGWMRDGLQKNDAGYKALSKRLEGLSRYASKFNIQIAFHPHLGTIIEDERDILKLIEFSKSVKLCVDTAHLIAAGSDPCAVIKRHASIIAHIHLKDWDPKTKDFVELGRGVLRNRIKDILETLEAINYTNWIIVELDRTSRTPFESAKISREFIKGVGY
ncbi:MAG: hypothetical protein AMJ78_04825 [Omnitrophica WOR_2 bacterium SM23_29]|nr:MAG: hypothetical protein AMJ78_04825 [Omnitrophica WOR_2 bacterium SM23_29]